MSERNHRQPALDPLIEGYLDYLLDVARKAPGTVRDVRCTLRRVSQAMERLAPDRSLWKLELLDYLRWIEGERQTGRGGAGLNKNLSHLRGVDLAVIARLMGHRSPAETGVYLHVLKDRPQRAVNRLDLTGGDAT